jgi:hypothetical protein
MSIPIIRNFVLGGSIIASVSYLATFVNPVIASILWSYPISIIPTMYFMNEQGKSNEYISKFLLSASYALILLVLTTFSLSYYLKQQKNGIWMPIFHATKWWLLGSCIFYLIIMYGGYSDKFL